MLGTAGLGIAWKAKPKVQREAPQRLNGKSLADLLYLLGPGDGVPKDAWSGVVNGLSVT